MSNDTHFCIICFPFRCFLLLLLLLFLPNTLAWTRIWQREKRTEQSITAHWVLHAIQAKRCVQHFEWRCDREHLRKVEKDGRTTLKKSIHYFFFSLPFVHSVRFNVNVAFLCCKNTTVDYLKTQASHQHTTASNKQHYILPPRAVNPCEYIRTHITIDAFTYCFFLYTHSYNH